jgi:hypothetical protein
MKVFKNSSQSAESIEIDASGSYDTYLEYNKILRTWFVAFGVGGPALLLTHDRLIRQLTGVGNLKCVLGLFLVGVAVQVFGAFVNKVANWYVHQAYTREEELWRLRRYQFFEWIAGQFWIDVVMDIVTIVVFGWAAVLMLTALAA